MILLMLLGFSTPPLRGGVLLALQLEGTACAYPGCSDPCCLGNHVFQISGDTPSLRHDPVLIREAAPYEGELGVSAVHYKNSGRGDFIGSAQIVVLMPRALGRLLQRCLALHYTWGRSVLCGSQGGVWFFVSRQGCQLSR